MVAVKTPMLPDFLWHGAEAITEAWIGRKRSAL
jgi:hypothetical protein